MRRALIGRMAMIGSVSLVLGGGLSPAVSAPPLYEGKRINLIVGFAPGGSADLDGRLVSQYLAKHIEGHPNIIVQNMPGAGGLKAINLAYNTAAPDGMAFYQLASGHYLQQLAGSSTIQFDLSKMPILGAWTRSSYVLVVRTDKFKSIEEMRAAKEPPIIATQGIGTGTYIYTIAWQRALGLNFKLVTGYGSAEQDLAIERGEVDGRTNSAKGIFESNPHWIAKNFALPLVQGGPVKDPLIPNVPTVQELNPNPGAFFETINEGLSVARPYVLTPGTPLDRLTALRSGWAAMLKDKDFIAEAERRGFEFVPTPHEQVEAFYKKVITQAAPDVVSTLQTLFP